MSRTEVLVQFVVRELRQRQALLDAAGDLAEVTITVKLQAGTTWVRGTVYQEERVVRTRESRQ